ncbi:MAG TPA: ATP-binding protein [Vicinamibacteria bacterium]|nr:ATP-binding protein [Vicinamibacteria bacterium]
MLGDGVLGLLSLAVLIGGSEKIVSHAAILMEQRGISGSFIGLAIISIGTSLPEILTHVIASTDILAGRIDPDVAAATVLGTNVGSDIAQQNLLIGIVALAGALTFTKTLLYRDFGIMIGVAALVLAFGWNGWLSRAQGAVLMAGYLVYLVVIYRSPSRDEAAEQVPPPETDSRTDAWRHWTWIVGGLCAIVLAGHFVLQVAEHLVKRFELGGSLIGVSVIGLSTSLPELSTALASIRKGRSELSVGTLVGSNITNPMLALGLGMLISGYSVPDVVLEFDLPVKIGTAIVIFTFLLSGRRLSKLESVILIGMYVSYLASRMWLYPDDVGARRPDPGASLAGSASATPKGGVGFPRACEPLYSGDPAVGERPHTGNLFPSPRRTVMSDEVDGNRAKSPPRETKRARTAEWEEALECFRLSQEVGGVGTWDWNVRDDVSVSSEENGRLFGLEPEENLSYPRWIGLIHPDDRDEVERVVREALSGAATYETEFRVPRRDGRERWIRAKGRVQFDDGGAPIRLVGVHIDVTARKGLELDRESTAAETLRASKLKDDFLAMLGHELRNPIGAIVNGIELLRSDSTHEHREWAEKMIERQTRQLKRLVDDILEISRITRGQLELRPEVVSLSACVEAARDAVRERLQDDPRDFHMRLPNERIYLFADAARIQQIFGNLLSNAIKYTNVGERIELSAERRGDRVIIRVDDDGEGLSEEHLNVVFEPFVRVSESLRRAGSGLGIGLTLVKKLVELHGGTITARSQGPGMGCTFTVELPIHQGEPLSDGDASTDALRPLRILVIEDNKDLALGLKKRLESRGHEVTLSHDGPQGIAAARQARPQVVLVDVGLPSMDGYKVARRLRAEASTPMLIAGISGFKERGEDKVAAQTFDHYFLKPVDAEQLNAWLTAVAAELEEEDKDHDTA